MFKGSITALITPFQNEGIDWTAFEKFLEFQITEGSHGLVPCGTTGESPTLSHDEHREVIKRCVEITDKRVPVIAGTGSNSTAEAIELTAMAQKDGADAALIVTPYYNKPTQEGLYAHFTAIHEASHLPIIIYNIPGRSVINMSTETMAALAKLPRIIGVKDATDDAGRPVLTRLACGSDFCQLSGEDGSIGAFLGQGGHGIISVLSNIAPKLCSQMHEAWQARDLDQFASLRDRLMPLAAALFCETSPAPVKYAASVLGLCKADVRLPLVAASQDARDAVDKALKAAELV